MNASVEKQIIINIFQNIDKYDAEMKKKILLYLEDNLFYVAPNSENATNKSCLYDYSEKIEKVNKLKSYIQIYHERLDEIEKQLIQNKVQYLTQCEQFEQRTPEWYNIRTTMFTASSDVCDILGKSEYNGSAEKTIKKKCGECKPFKGNKFTNHGVKYENIATAIYESRYDKTVLEFGLLRHPTIHCLGASPDGITTD